MLDYILLQTSDGKLNEGAITEKMGEEMNNDKNWKSIWQPTLNKCFNEGKIQFHV